MTHKRLDAEVNVQEVRIEMEARTTEELTSILRNHDETEWRPVVFEIVASILRRRGLRPGDIAALGPEGYDAAHFQDMRTVARFFTPADAQAARAALEAAGITAWVLDDNLGTSFGVAVRTRVLVRPSDLAAAQALLAERGVPATELPPELSEPPCPVCGSARVTQEARVGDDPPFGVTLGSRRIWTFVCLACGHAWTA